MSSVLKKADKLNLSLSLSPVDDKMGGEGETEETGFATKEMATEEMATGEAIEEEEIDMEEALMSNHARYSLPLQSITHMDLWVMVSVFRSNSTIWSFLRTGYSVVLLQWFQSITTFPSFNDDVRIHIKGV